MNTLIKFEFNGWTIARADAADIWRIQDIDLAKRLGYQQPRDIRKLIRRMGEKGELRLSDADRSGEVLMRATVERIEKRGAIHGIENRKVTEFWLSRTQALKVSARSETPPADALLDEMIRVFELALDGRLPGPPDALAKVAGIQLTVDASLRAFADRLSSDQAEFRGAIDAKFAALDRSLSSMHAVHSRSAATVSVLAQQGNATMTVSEQSRLNALRRAVAQLLVDVHHKKPRAAWRIVQNALEEASGWCGKVKDLPVAKYQEACRALERLKASLAREARTGSQLSLKLEP